MSDIIIKSEKENDNDSNSNSNSSLADLTTLLQEVKKEEHKSLSDEETQTENNKDAGETLPESFFDDLYRDELEASAADATTDADIQKLQEIIAKKKRILHGDVDREPPGNIRRSRSRSHSPDSRKRKQQERNNENQRKSSQAKRSRHTIDTPQEVITNRSESPILNTPLDHDSNNEQPPPSTENDCPPSSEHDQADDAELELENLLKTDDYNSDEETPKSSLGINNIMQPMYGFPNAMPMVPTMYNPATNQMMTNMPSGGYPMMYNMGFPPGFCPPNMMNMQNMQMMGYGLPQMNMPLSNDDELQCLPVSNTGLPKITFKKIKLEKVTKPAAPAENPKRKIIDDCVKLLEKINFPEPSGKFVYTSTVAKDINTAGSNSVLQKITNVSYNFQSIGSKQNLQDWGLKGIPNANAEIAKNISMSANKYFSKISENANTTARKLIKEEAAKADKNRKEEEMEVELTMSSYFKNSMTQTDPIVCRECVARKRKVGHDIAVQATVFTGTIDTQTDPEVRFNEQLTEGLRDNQLKALYEFSLLIREPPKNTSVELFRLREQLMNMYNKSQRQHQGIVPFIDASSTHLAKVQNSARDPRIDNRSMSDPRRFTDAGIQNQMIHKHPVQTEILAHVGTQNQMVHQCPVQTPRQNIPNYPQHRMQIQNQQQIPSAQFPRQNRYDQGYVAGRPQERPMQIPTLQRPANAPQYPDQPEFAAQEFPQQDGRKNYGRGGLRR